MVRPNIEYGLNLLEKVLKHPIRFKFHFDILVAGRQTLVLASSLLFDFIETLLGRLNCSSYEPFQRQD